VLRVIEVPVVDKCDINVAKLLLSSCPPALIVEPVLSLADEPTLINFIDIF
jgi:hypothetical protein